MNLFQKIADYFRSSLAEAKKVSWPTRQDTIRYSALVIGLSLGVAAFFASLDYGLTALVDATLTARQSSTQAPASAEQTNVVPTTEPAPASEGPSSTSPTIDLNNAQPINTAPDKK